MFIKSTKNNKNADKDIHRNFYKTLLLIQTRINNQL